MFAGIPVYMYTVVYTLVAVNIRKMLKMLTKKPQCLSYRAWLGNWCTPWLLIGVHVQECNQFAHVMKLNRA